MTILWQGFTESAEFFNGKELIELGDFVIKQDNNYWIPILEG